MANQFDWGFNTKSATDNKSLFIKIVPRKKGRVFADMANTRAEYGTGGY